MRIPFAVGGGFTMLDGGVIGGLFTAIGLPAAAPGIGVAKAVETASAAASAQRVRDFMTGSDRELLGLGDVSAASIDDLFEGVGVQAGMTSALSASRRPKSLIRPKCSEAVCRLRGSQALGILWLASGLREPIR